MSTFDVQCLIFNIDELIFSNTGEHLDDLQCQILEGVINHKKYREIGKTHHHSEKYVRDIAGKLWQTLSVIIGEKVSKSNFQSSFERYYYQNFSNPINVKNIISINNNFCEEKLENKTILSSLEKEIKQEIAMELMKEGLNIEQIAKILKLPLDLVQKWLKKLDY
ncbi:ATPase [Cyanobacterium sp. IPPAS B-1200]|uniref:ATPase n=1 Tax=Cyanobacterium sp. IPPAS B-1200 TaxID=1562720 RepID=UPI0008526E63|nr:ATPase [Cyanobacterium sp. IPPAS B-1200]OEJ78317.1 ATPase [Cyanobacterium sp. IPPAS B-1200]